MTGSICHRACRSKPTGRFSDKAGSGKCRSSSASRTWVGIPMKRNRKGEFSGHARGGVICGGKRFGK